MSVRETRGTRGTRNFAVVVIAVLAIVVLVSGAFTLFGGKGADYIQVADDGFPDLINCGDGSDHVNLVNNTKDPLDTFVHCEVIN